MKEMIRKYRGTLISSALVILAGVLVGFTSIQGKWINLFFVVMQCVFVAIIFYDNRNRQQNRKVIYGIHLLWDRFNVHGYRKLSAKGKTEQYDRNQGRMDIAG